MTHDEAREIVRRRLFVGEAARADTIAACKRDNDECDRMLAYIDQQEAAERERDVDFWRDANEANKRNGATLSGRIAELERENASLRPSAFVCFQCEGTPVVQGYCEECKI